MITRQTRRGILLLLLLTVLTWIVARPPTQPESRPRAGLDTRLNYALHDFSGRLLNEQGLTRIEVRAPLLRNDTSSGIGTVEEPRFRILQEQEEWNISAESAIISADRELVTMSGEVRLERRNVLTGDILNIETRNVQLNITPRTASTGEHVSIVHAEDRIDALGMNLDMINDQFELLEAVQARYDVP